MTLTFFRRPRIRQCASLVLLAGMCVALSTLWRIPYIYTLIAYSVWTLANELVLDEDELISGGILTEEITHLSLPSLAIKGFLLLSLCYVALQFPAIRNLGGNLGMS